MTNIIQGAEKIMNAYDKAFLYDDIPEKDRSLMQILRDAFKHADFYEIDREMTEFAYAQNNDAFDGKLLADIRAPVDARPPSDICFVYLPNTETGFMTIKHRAGERRQIHHPSVDVIRVTHTETPVSCGCYVIADDESQNEIFLPDLTNNNEREHSLMASIMMTVCTVYSLINQPRFVVRGKSGTRQGRKQMLRGHGISLDAWNKISWNIGEPVKAKDDHSKGGFHMPLHYTRGYWRKAQDHWDNVVIRKDGQPYKWVEGYWAGHPAYGVKHSYHAPKLGKNYENV